MKADAVPKHSRYVLDKTNNFVFYLMHQMHHKLNTYPYGSNAKITWIKLGLKLSKAKVNTKLTVLEKEKLICYAFAKFCDC